MKLVSFQDGEVVRRKKKEYSRNSLPHLFCFLFSGAGGVFSVPVNETFLGIISYYLCTAGKKKSFANKGTLHSHHNANNKQR